MNKVVAVPVQLVNEYGTGYGTNWLIFAERPEDADKWIEDHIAYELYDSSRSVWEQTHATVTTYYDGGGNASREAWWLLLEEFAKKNIGPSALKKIARMSQWWPPER